MIIKGLVDEDFVNYKEPSMFIIFNKCDFKCDRENGTNYCYNSPLVHHAEINVGVDRIYERYNSNPITRAVVCGGLEPFDTPEQLVDLIRYFRSRCNDTIVIYTGYTEEELQPNAAANIVKQFNNIIIKYGRFRPNQEKHLDEILGIKLASDNQYAVAYNMEDK